MRSQGTDSPILAIVSERLKEVSNHSSQVTLRWGAVEPGINHFPYPTRAATPLPSLEEVGAEVAQKRGAGEAGSGGARPLARTAAAAKPRLPHPPTARATAFSSPSQRKRSPSTECLPGLCLDLPDPDPQGPAATAGGTRSCGASTEGGGVEGEGPQRPPAAHAQCQAPARLPTVGTAKPRSPASAASPEPLATSTRRERRPEVTRRPEGLLPRRPPARG